MRGPEFTVPFFPIVEHEQAGTNVVHFRRGQLFERPTVPVGSSQYPGRQYWSVYTGVRRILLVLSVHTNTLYSTAVTLLYHVYGIVQL